MSEAKSVIIENLSLISDSETDEFVVLEDLYKLMKLRKSQISAETDGTLSTNEVKEYFYRKRQGKEVTC